jgi:hypothetical protein
MTIYFASAIVEMEGGEQGFVNGFIDSEKISKLNYREFLDVANKELAAKFQAERECNVTQIIILNLTRIK